ncbi:MAG: hypothetical protein KC636_35185, partial [Myxococcales bacterium]|nr:hypothetical protein [Myxococcales bacterium]
MILLRQYLEDNKLVNESDIASIGQRQSIYGGSFDTNLLELQILKPEEVDAALEEACGLPTLPSALLERRDERPWDTLPGQLVDRGWVAAIARAGDRLIVATHPELPDAQLGYLYRKIRGFTPVVTAECCIAALNAERTGQTLGGRYAPLIASYRDALQAHRADVGGELLAPTPAPTPAPEPEPAPAAVEREPDAVTGPSADRRSSVAKLEETLEKLRVPGRPVHKPPPLSITLAKQLGKPRTRLVLARESNKATEALARAAAIIAPRVALLAVKRDGLHALEAPGSSLRLEKDIVIPLEPYSRIERAVLGDVVLTETSSRPLRGALEQRHAIPCIFAPIRVQARPVLVLYLDRNGHDFDPAERAAARDLCDVAEKTFEEVLRLIQRKSGQRSSHRLKTELIHEALHVSAAAPEPP